MNPAPAGAYRPDGDFALLEHVARTIDDFVLVTDAEGNLTYVNEAVLARSGWTRDELLGKPWRLFLGDVNPPDLAETITAATRSGTSFGRRKTCPGTVTRRTVSHDSSVARSSGVSAPSPFSACTTQAGTCVSQSRRAGSSSRCNQRRYSCNPWRMSRVLFRAKSACNSA